MNRQKNYSSQPRKQRKRQYNADHFSRRKFFRVHLDKNLRESLGRRSFPIRVGDKVKIIRGELKGTTGKVSQVLRKKCRLVIEGIQRERVDGTKRPRYIHPSNVMITELDMKDRIREKIIERRS